MDRLKISEDRIKIHIRETPTPADGPFIVWRLQKTDLRRITWKKNLFMVPSGQRGKTFIREVTQHLEEFARGTKHQIVSMSSIIIKPVLLLQKPRFETKAKEHSALLEQRFHQWKQGDISELLRACCSIQNRLHSGRTKTDPEALNKNCSFMVK